MPAAKQITDSMREEIIARYQDGQTINVIYKAMGISPLILSRTLVGANIPLEKNRGRRLTPSQQETALILYEQGKNLGEIANEFGCSLEPIKRIIGHARARGHIKREAPGKLMDKACQDRQSMISDYHKGLSTYALHKKYGHHYIYIRKILKQSGIDMRDDRTRRGQDCPMYKTGKSMTAEGYVLVLVPETSQFSCMRTARGYVLEHRLVMAQHLGRPLFPYETVHHRNGNKQDNRIENLEHWERSHGEGQRVDENPVPHCPTCTCKNPYTFTVAKKLSLRYPPGFPESGDATPGCSAATCSCPPGPSPTSF